ncbi:VAN3-binding protein-like isoform X1 [Populus alba x Populus x berolinensis]|uniref:VAN3-binding protein-like isoform X1 n=1 Tax=Populus alba x Populus x berolinensis TaxID=444605 RepID=A0AAD6RC42_9ROSI|nr:VAN3-binding protein-like isoform X1 [Populus alba x Populus x berolinensis]
MEEIPLLNLRRPAYSPVCSNIPLPESPKLPMEFLSRSWSVSALEVSKSLTCMASNKSASSSTCTDASSIPEDVTGEMTEEIVHPNPFANQFPFGSSQLVLERIMSQSEVSPLASGRLSHSSGPLNLTESESPPISPSDEFEDIVKYFRSHNTLNPLFSGGRASAGPGSGAPPSGAKTVGRWLKDRKEKKKEETRTQNAQLHAAVSVAAVASAIAAIAAATASSASGKNEQLTKTDMAVASAATLVAAQFVEAAEAMGAERDHLASVVTSAVNVHSHDDITTLTAAAATALRGAATLKARALKDVLNVAAVIPMERGIGIYGVGNYVHHNRSYSGEISNGENFSGACSVEFLARGSELLKRTRQGDLHWKIVSVYIHRTGQVMLKMKSRHIAGTITKKKKNVVLEVCKDLPTWPGRHLLEGGDQRRYFGLKTLARGIVDFECKNQREHDIWTQGVSRLLSIVSQRKNRIPI